MNRLKIPSIEQDSDEPDDFIKTLLNEEKASKKQKKSDPHEDVRAQAAAAVRRGKTFAEIEAEEGGPIKESLVGMAHTKRALDRKKKDVEVGDTELVANTERYEKDTLEVEEEDGIKFEPFNLKQEREEGFFDEDGNYVFRKQAGEEGDEEKDAWLDSGETKVVSEAVRQRIEAQRAQAEAAARRAPLTERQIAQRKADMAAIMQPGETVTRALKRLGGAGGAGAATAAGLPHRAMGKRERARLLAQQQELLQKQQQKQQQGSSNSNGAADAGPSTAGSGTDADTQRRVQFLRLTELADELLEEGELEIYGETQEALTRSARMWLPQLAAAGAAPAAVGGGGAAWPAGGAAGAGAEAGTSAGRAAAAAADADDDDDMFADADDDDDDKGSSAKQRAAGGAGVAAAAAAPVAVDEDQDMFADDEEGEKGKEDVGKGGAGSSGNG
ncbi:hypothetical protein Agub_g2402, partial [Astrephomene gubernaculifera]